MALFKVYRGNESNLPIEMNDGWAYFCTDSGNFYIDWLNGSELTRTQINANYASNLKYLDGDEYAEIDATTLMQELASMSDRINVLEDSCVQSDWNQNDETAPAFIKNKPEIATDDEIIEMLMQEDMIPIVVDADGSILSDENSNILLW